MAGLFAGAGQFLPVPRTIILTKKMRSPRIPFPGAAPPVVRPGAQFAVLEGDPTASTGDYTIRLKMPDGFRIAPHWHPQRENVTIISGTFKVGMGDEFDPNADESVPCRELCLSRPRHASLCHGMREKPSCRSTANLPFSSTTSILTMTRPGRNSTSHRQEGGRRSSLRERRFLGHTRNRAAFVRNTVMVHQ